MLFCICKTVDETGKRENGKSKCNGVTANKQMARWHVGAKAGILQSGSENTAIYQ